MTKRGSRLVSLLAVALLVPMLTTACGSSVRQITDDGTISTRVKTTLLNDTDVGGQRIEVETFDGVVTLSGKVKSEADRDKAVALARRITGVKDVKSTLQVGQ